MQSAVLSNSERCLRPQRFCMHASAPHGLQALLMSGCPVAGPPGTNYAVMKKAFQEGWGAVIAKTVSVDSSKVSTAVPVQTLSAELPEMQWICFASVLCLCKGSAKFSGSRLLVAAMSCQMFGQCKPCQRG